MLGRIVIVLLLSTSAAMGQTLTIGSYNMLTGPRTAADESDLQTIVSAFGNIDLLAFQEGPNAQGDVERIDDVLEAAFPSTSYSVDYTTPKSGLRTGFVYDDSSLSIVAGTESTIASTTQNIRRAQFQPVGGSVADRFYAYSLHLNAGSQTSRLNDVTDILSDVGTLPSGSNVLYLGDFNFQGSNESGYVSLHQAGVRDTLNAPFGPDGELGGETGVTWNDNLAYHHVHSQSTNAFGGAGGGIDDRFDMQLISSELLDGGGLEYVKGSVQTFGNRGQHTMSGPLDSGAPAFSSLTAFSDHLPILAQYEFGVTAQTFNKPNTGVTSSADVADRTFDQNGDQGPISSSCLSDFCVEGSGNGGFATFGIIDIDLSNVLAANESATLVDDIYVSLSQENFSFSENGPISIYLADETVPVSSLSYQSGANELASAPGLSGSAVKLATYGYDEVADGNVDNIPLYGPNVKMAVLSKLNGGGTLRLLVVPDEADTAATYSSDIGFFFNLNTVAVPEPSAFVFLSLICVAGAGWRRRVAFAL